MFEFRGPALPVPSPPEPTAEYDLSGSLSYLQMALSTMYRAARAPEFRLALQTQSEQIRRIQRDLDAASLDRGETPSAPPCEIVQAALGEVVHLIWAGRLGGSPDPGLLKVALKLSVRLLVLLEWLPLRLPPGEGLSQAQMDTAQACGWYTRLGASTCSSGDEQSIRHSN